MDFSKALHALEQKAERQSQALEDTHAMIRAIKEARTCAEAVPTNVEAHAASTATARKPTPITKLS